MASHQSTAKGIVMYVHLLQNIVSSLYLYRTLGCFLQLADLLNSGDAHHAQDVLRHARSRSSSRNSGLQSRGSSKKSTAVQETARLLEGLTAFKAKLAASHRQTMQLLEGDLTP